MGPERVGLAPPPPRGWAGAGGVEWGHCRRAGWRLGEETLPAAAFATAPDLRAVLAGSPPYGARREASLSILSSPREALGHVPRPDKDRLHARSAARNLATCATRAAAPAWPGDARSVSGGNGKAAPLLPPSPLALSAGVAVRPRSSPFSLPLPLAFLPGASSRGTPASHRPRTPAQSWEP